MLNLKKEADTLKADEFRLATCPICSSYVCHMYFMQDGKTKEQSKWFSCACGVIFQENKPNKVYDKKYHDDHEQHDEKLKDSFEYPIKIYSPIIEELIYGRKVLLIGKPTDHQHKEFERRGWISYSIDKNTSYVPNDRLFVGDFEHYQFGSDIKFNMIWMYGTLECFHDPVKALAKCKDLLVEDGILFIASPDTDFVNTRGSSSFIHWKPSMHFLMWNRRSISKHLDSLGFNVIMARQNYEHRFPQWDDFHLIAQKKFF